MDQNNILIEKLSLQVKSFQEGFELLLNSPNFLEMTKTFAHLLRGNFILKDLYLLHKIPGLKSWTSVGFKNDPAIQDLKYLNDAANFSIKYLENDNYSAVIVLPLSDSSTLGILIGKKLDGENLSVLDKITLQILLQVFDSAHKASLSQKKVKKLIFELNEKAFQLNNLIDTGIELSKFEKRSILYRLALERVASITNASSALFEVIPKSDDKEKEMYIFPEGIDPKYVVNNKFKLESSFDFEDHIYRLTISEKETRTGVTEFSALDKTLLDAICKQVSASIENQFLLKQSIEKERIEKELNVAAAIQQQIIPKQLPKIDGYDLAGINIPSREVGGDYYDCIKLGPDKYALIIADVAGKGIAAALLVNTLNAALYSYLDFNLPAAEMSDKLNKLIYKASPPDKFITFFIAILEPSTGNMEVVNAGHNPILLKRKDGTLEKIDASGVGLGMLDFGIPYTGQTLVLNQGDSLFLYTDGIPEAMNLSEEEYTDERMIDFFMNNSHRSVKDFTNEMIKDVKSYTQGAFQSDDITLMILKRI